MCYKIERKNFSETSMGTALDPNDSADKEYEEAILGVSKIFVNRLLRPWLYFQCIYYYFSPLGRQERKLTNILHNFTDKVIKKRKEEMNSFMENSSNSKRKRMAMLDLLLYAEKDGLIDLKGIRDEINTFMFEVEGSQYYFGTFLTLVPFSGP